MDNLTAKMAAYGFESNDDFTFPIRCFMESGGGGRLRALNIEGDSERRKTAFAYALAQALGFKRVFYHDFTEENPPLPDIVLPPSRDEMGREEPAIAQLDLVVSEACAVSEAEPTVLILDQLHTADFREHLRVNRLIVESGWGFRDARYFASSKNLCVFIVSEEPLYHSLQKVSYRIWVNRVSERQVEYDPLEFGLGTDARPLFDALAALFRAIGSAPTRSEFGKILTDIQLRVRTVEHLCYSLYGWSEDVDRERLYAPEAREPLEAAVDAIGEFVGIDEIEIGG